MFFSLNCGNYSYTNLFCSFEACLLILTTNMSFISKKCFSHQIVPHTATISFSAVFFVFTEIDQKMTGRSINCFSHQIEPHKATVSYSAILKHFLCISTKKLVILVKRCFAHQNEPHISSLSFSAVLKLFLLKLTKKLLFRSKSVLLIILSHRATLRFSIVLKHVY